MRLQWVGAGPCCKGKDPERMSEQGEARCADSARWRQ